MEAAMINATGDYNRRIGNPKRSFVANRGLYSFPSDDLASLLIGGHFGGGGLLTMPSYPPAVSVLRPPQNLQHHRQQPPLLPLPISMPLNHLNMNIYRSNSCSNANIRLSPPRMNKSLKNRGRDHSLTPKKSKSQKKNSKREEVDLIPPPAVTEETETESSITQMMGPDPKDLPKDVMISRVFNSSTNKSSSCNIVSVDVDKFSGSVVFTPSPPPSSLPLPTFSLRPKLSCNVQAAGVDAGATDSLRRLLRL